MFWGWIVVTGLGSTLMISTITHFFQRQLTCNKYLLQLQGSGARLHGSGQFAAGVRRNHNGSM